MPLHVDPNEPISYTSTYIYISPHIYVQISG